MIALNQSTKILIDNFISTNFSSIPSENRAKIKNDFVEIADSILEQSNKDLDRLATKGDIVIVKEDIVAMKSDIVALKNDVVALKGDVNKKFDELKYDLLKWIITTQIAIGGFLFGAITLALYLLR